MIANHSTADLNGSLCEEAIFSSGFEEKKKSVLVIIQLQNQRTKYSRLQLTFVSAVLTYLGYILKEPIKISMNVFYIFLVKRIIKITLK